MSSGNNSFPWLGLAALIGSTFCLLGTAAAQSQETVQRIKGDVSHALGLARASSGMVTVTYQYPTLGEEKNKTFTTMFGFDDMRMYSAVVEDFNETNVLNAKTVAVTSPSVSFVLTKGSGPQFLVADIRAGEHAREELSAAVYANTGFVTARYATAFIDLSKHLGAPGWKTVSAELKDESLATVEYTCKVDGSLRKGEFEYDFDVNGLRALRVVNGSLEESVVVEYTSAEGSGDSFPSRIVHELRDSGTLTQVTETLVHSWLPSPPPPEVFDIRFYGVEGATAPRHTMMPRWLALTLILVVLGAGVLLARHINAGRT